MRTHHARLYVATPLATVAAREPLALGHVDTRHYQSATLSIGAVRELIDEAYRRPVDAPVRTLVVEAGAIAPEAQHALLKILEEPPATTRFVLLLPSVAQLLPTVLSRVEVVAATAATEVGGASDDFTAFLAASYADRLASIATRTKAKDLAWGRAIVAGAAAYHRALASTDPAWRTLGETLLVVSRYQALRGSSQKMLLEALALALPLTPASR